MPSAVLHCTAEMPVKLPRTVVSFSSTDYDYYTLMTAWKANENIDFDFADFQLNDAIQSLRTSTTSSPSAPGESAAQTRSFS